MTPEMLVVGHIVKDVTPSGWRAGGGVCYAGVQAARLGLRTAPPTACSADVDPAAMLPDVEWRVLPADVTTTFENSYSRGQRSQRLLATAPPLSLDDLPSQWRAAPIIL